MIMFSMFPQFTETVVAEETTIPVEQFATVDQLKSFNTNDNDGEVKSAKVYFGNNDQQWWIAGSQNGNLTLFAERPLPFTVTFNQDTNEKDYNGQQVYSNHYGASDIRNTLKGLKTSYFTSEEQALMNETTIYTNDTKNGSVYSTTDKLYLAYGQNSTQYITVGTNSRDSLNEGLRIDKNYFGYNAFWLRAPLDSRNHHALFVYSSNWVTDDKVTYSNMLMPAFELNLSSVIFASTASAATSTGALSTNEAFTLRYKSDTLGSALISYDGSSVALTDVQNGTYLVVQNSAGAKAKQIANETTVSASDMGVDTFANCKVWLEITDTSERKTYATLAESVSKDAVARVGDTYYNNLETAINASSPENPAIMLKDVTVGNNRYTISKDNAVLDTNGYTLDFNTVSSYITLDFNQSFTIKGSGNKDKPDLVIGQLWVNPGYDVNFS